MNTNLINASNNEIQNESVNENLIINKNNNFQISLCLESNFTIKSSYLSTINDTDKKIKNKNISMYNTSIFIGGHQNLKSKRIHLSKYNNTVHREITNFRNKKNKSVDRVNIHLQRYSNGQEQIEQLDVIKMMNIRWQNNLKKEKNNSISIINQKENNTNFIKANIEDLLNKVNENYNFDDKLNKDYFILLKLDKYKQKNFYIYDLVVPNSIEDLEKSINKFMLKKCNQENKDNNTDSASSLKKSTLSKNSYKENFNDFNDYGILYEDYSPIFILHQNDLKNIYNKIEPKIEEKKKDNIIYKINNFSLNYKPTNNKEILRSKPNNAILKNEKEILTLINVETFTICNSIERNTEQNNDVNNINLDKELVICNNEPIQLNEIKNIQEVKQVEDFSQNTPIHLLTEKYNIYSVSKWLKYNFPNPQNGFTIPFKTKKESPILKITSFTLCIERIETKRNSKLKGQFSINSSANSKLINNSSGIGKSLTYNKNIKGNINSNKASNNNIANNSSLIKPINLKSKVFK